jgi:hypothetical protein
MKTLLVMAAVAAAMCLTGSFSQALAAVGDARVVDEKPLSAKPSMIEIPVNAAADALRQEKTPLIRVAPLVAPHSCGSGCSTG